MHDATPYLCALETESASRWSMCKKKKKKKDESKVNGIFLFGLTACVCVSVTHDATGEAAGFKIGRIHTAASKFNREEEKKRG